MDAPTTTALVMRAAAPRSFVRCIDGVKLHWVEYGPPGPRVPVGLLHGLTDSHLTWQQLAPELARDRRVLVEASVQKRGFPERRMRGMTPVMQTSPSPIASPSTPMLAPSPSPPLRVPALASARAPAHAYASAPRSPAVAPAPIAAPVASERFPVPAPAVSPAPAAPSELPGNLYDIPAPSDPANTYDSPDPTVPPKPEWDRVSVREQADRGLSLPTT